jgi:hypothetical protein
VVRQHPLLADPRIIDAIKEFTGTIEKHFPVAEFGTYIGDDPVGVYLRAVVDIDDPDEVVDLIVDRLITLQVDEELPFYVIPVRTPERAAAVRAQNRRSWFSSEHLLSAIG